MKEKVKKINTNISLSVNLKKALKIYAVNNDTNLSEILNEIGRAFLSNLNNSEKNKGC